MPKFRKKPVVIEAIQWDGKLETLAAIQKLNTLNRALSTEEDFLEGEKSLMIETLEGTHEGKINDWIIQGVSGELYPCKPDIFKMTYEPAMTKVQKYRLEPVEFNRISTTNDFRPNHSGFLGIVDEQLLIEMGAQPVPQDTPEIEKLDSYMNTHREIVEDWGEDYPITTEEIQRQVNTILFSKINQIIKHIESQR